MNNKQSSGFEKIPVVLIVIAFLVLPPLGILLIVLKYMIKPKAKQMRPGETIIDNDQWEDDQDNRYSNRRKTPIETFGKTITVRCPHCQSSNFTDHLPMKCEYCGEPITKKS